MFWRATPHETFAAIEAFRRANDPRAEDAEREAKFEAWADTVMAAVG